jgi:elongator complex protein 2
LASHTLWPETNKLYGHGYEISIVEVSPDGKIIVSAAKSQTKKFSSLIFWNIQNFQVEYQIEAHTYTILDIKFFKNRILTVSRDRNIALYSLNSDTNKYELTHIQKGHSRLINSVCVDLSGELIVTGSRDKFLKIWKIVDNKIKEINKIKIGFFIKAVEFFRNDILLIGLDDGKILIGKVDRVSSNVEIVDEISASIGCGKSINKIRRSKDLNSDLFACCSEDKTVRVYQLKY